MPDRTLAIDLHAHALIPEVEALVHGQEGLRRDQEARADWARAVALDASLKSHVPAASAGASKTSPTSKP